MAAKFKIPSRDRLSYDTLQALGALVLSHQRAGALGDPLDEKKARKVHPYLADDGIWAATKAVVGLP